MKKSNLKLLKGFCVLTFVIASILLLGGYMGYSYININIAIFLYILSIVLGIIIWAKKDSCKKDKKIEESKIKEKKGERFCEKCKKEAEDINKKFCNECGGKIVTRSEHRKNKKRMKKLWVGLAIWIFILVVVSIIIFAIPFPYKAIEKYSVQEPYTTTEDYVEWENSKNCDYDRDCSCKHYSWLGLGACDSCKCYRTRSVTKYKTVYKEKEVQKKATLYQQWSGQAPRYY